MNKNNNITKIVIMWIAGFLALAVLIVGISAATIWSHRNEVMAIEERINAQYNANKSNYDNMWKRFMEMTQVTEIQSKQIKDTYEGLIAGRYNDPNVLFKMVQESNPQLDATVYSQLQREISAGRLQFDNNQKSISDMIREHNTLVRQYIVMTAITGRTPIDGSKYIVTSDQTQEAFNKGKSDAINLTGK